MSSNTRSADGRTGGTAATTVHGSRRDLGHRIVQLRAELGRPVDGSALAYWRVAFGTIVAWEMWRFYDHDWVEGHYSGRAFYFTYWPFTFVEPLPILWLMLSFATVGAAGICMALGLYYRLSSAVVFFGLAYVFLLDRTYYLNHFYLLVLLAFLMMLVPANRVWSLDARRRHAAASGPDRSSAPLESWTVRSLGVGRLQRTRPPASDPSVPAWSLWLIRFQVGVPYFFGGVAKINGDWLRGEPLREWLADRTDFPVVGRLFTAEATVWFMAYGALFLDLLVVFFLLNRRTRTLAFGAAVVFHLVNSRLFGIGVFPWTMILATAVFFDADWPRRVLGDLRSTELAARRRSTGWWTGALLGFFFGGFMPETFSPVRAAIGAVGVAILGYHAAGRVARNSALRPRQEASSPSASSPMRAATAAALGCWMFVQIVVPLRHFAIPGVVHWTEEGHRFAWHMKLRDKDAVATFTVTSPSTGQTWIVDNAQFLSRDQREEMVSEPDMIVQFAHHLAESWAEDGHGDVIVTVEAHASLNGRSYQRFIDPTVDLAAVSYPWWPGADWILPLETPLGARVDSQPGIGGDADEGDD